jgi:uncharacterized membrane protein YgcG
MTRTSAPQGATEEDTPGAHHRAMSRVPIWIRVSVITGVVLVGVLLSTMLLAASGIGDRGDSGGGHGSGAELEMEMEMDSDGSGGDHSSGGDHGSGGDRGSGGDHSSGSSHGS